MEETVNILLVDDEPRNLDALEVILENDGYHLIRATNADQALRELLQNDIAAIVLDIKMPGVSGFELAQLIKGMKRFRQIPILFLTAYLLEDDDVLAGYGAGAVDYLTKPIKPQILKQKVAAFADLFRKTRALAELNEHLEQRVSERTLELEKSKEALSTANAALREASRMKDLFLATLAHELRNPLAPLRTGLDLLLSTPEATISSQTRTLATMNRQLDHMVRLIDDLLDLSRITRGALELRREPTALVEVVEHAIETTKPLIDKKRQSVVVDADANVRAEVDPTRIAQIVSNLLNNASKFSPVEAKIRIELRADRDEVVIRVIDHGIGLAKEDLAHAFDMFAQLGGPGTGATGLGIGLALARRLAELHGGTLTASSRGEGKGSVFTLCVPNDTSEGTIQERSAAKPSPTPSNGKLDIVVIEDNDDAADLLMDWLQNLGHSVKVARNGPEGVDLVRDARPQLVLCDIGLPGMDGVEVCKAVRQMTGQHPVMVALTGWGMASDRERTRTAGFDHHLVKPVQPDHLRQLLAKVSSESDAG